MLNISEYPTKENLTIILATTNNMLDLYARNPENKLTPNEERIIANTISIIETTAIMIGMKP